MKIQSVVLSCDELRGARALVGAYQRDQAQPTPVHPWDVRERDAKRLEDVSQLPWGEPLALSLHHATLGTLCRFIGANVGEAADMARVGITDKQTETLLVLHCDLEALAETRGW